MPQYLRQFMLYEIGVVLILWLLFEYKAGYEEGLLEQKFAQYQLYKTKTGKIFPKIFK